MSGSILRHAVALGTSILLSCGVASAQTKPVELIGINAVSYTHLTLPTSDLV